MCLHDAIAWQGKVLLPAGKVLGAGDARTVGKRFPQLLVRVADPVLDCEVEFEDDSHERDVAEHAHQLISQSMSQVSERLTSRSSLREINFAAMQESVADVVRYLRHNPVSTVLLARNLDSDSYLPEHAANVFYLSMLLGAAVRDCVQTKHAQPQGATPPASTPSVDLQPLGLGAMFCDLGMYPLRHLICEEGPLSREDRQAIREHPITGAEMLPEDFSPLARTIVRTHHENYDGTGYPAQLPGSQLHLFARIVRIADAFDAATSQHVYRQAKSPARTLWEMLVGIYRRYYDPLLMKVFVRLIQPFPIGARLRLLDGRSAIVVRYNRRNPFLPTVVVAFDEGGDRLEPDAVEGPVPLDQQYELRIHSYAGEELGYIYDQTFFQALSPVRGDFTDTFEAAFP